MTIGAVSLLAAFVAASAADARLVTPQRWERVTVTTTDGWEYPGVTVELVDGGQALRLIRPDGAQRTLPLDQIRGLEDSIGRDITAHVIAGWSRRAEGPPPPAAGVPPRQRARSPIWWNESDDDRGRWEPRDRHQEKHEPFHEVAFPARRHRGTEPLATRFAVALGGAFGFGWNDGRWFRAYENAEYYQGQIRLAISGSVYLTGLYRRHELPRKVEAIPLPPVDDDEPLSVYPDLKLDQFLFGLGFMPRRHHWSDAIPYLELGYGRTEYTAVGQDGWLSGAVDKRTVFAQLGIIMPLGRDVALELAGSAVHSGDDLFDFGDDARSGTVLGAHAGLTILLGMVE
ncbi:MAG: hypothetical protein R6X25_07525 [Candidatus Krumholzibacteriia bacterium]